MKKSSALLIIAVVMAWALGMSVYLLSERYVYVRGENERLTNEVVRLSDTRTRDENGVGVLGAAERCSLAAKYVDRTYSTLNFTYNSCEWKIAEAVNGLPSGTLKRITAIFNERTVLQLDVLSETAGRGRKCITADYKGLQHDMYRFLTQANAGPNHDTNVYQYVKTIDVRNSREFCYLDNSTKLGDAANKLFVRITVQVSNDADPLVNKVDQIVEALRLT